MQSFITLPETGKTAWPYYIGTVALVGLGYVAGQLPFSATLAVLPDIDPEKFRAFQESLDFAIIGLDPVYGTYLMMLTYFGALIALWVGIKWIHGRSLWTLTGETLDPLLKKAGWALGVWIALSCVAESVFFISMPGKYEYLAMEGRWLSMVVLAIVFIPVQVIFEELFFRGYLLQSIGYAFNNAWIGAIVSSVFFALMHSLNPEVEHFGYWAMMGYYFLAGLFLAILTIYSNSLSLALGVHLATNVFSALIVGYEGGVFELPSLFRVYDVYVPWMTLSLILMAIVFIFIAGRRYHWGIVRADKDLDSVQIP